MTVYDIEMGHSAEELGAIWDGMAPGSPRTIDGTHRRKDGTTFPVEVRVGVLEAGGSPLLLALARDVTERKEAEEALKESEERFRLLADEAVEGIVLIENGGIFDANKTFTRMFGYELDELVGMGVGELVVPEDRETVVRRISSGDT